MARADERQPAPERTAPPTAANPRLFYGWVVVGAVFVILVVSSGLGFYNASVILAAATDELDASVGAVSGATGLFFAVSGLTGFAFSKRLDSADIRWFYLVGGITGALALLGLRLVDSVVALYIFFAVFGVGFALAGLVPSTTLVTRWFDRRRSVALSVASTGLSMGGIVVTPVAAWLIDRRSLAGAAPWMAALWIVGIIPIALLVLRSKPSDRGLRPDGAPAPNRSEIPSRTPHPDTASARPATSATSTARADLTSHADDSADAGHHPPAPAPDDPALQGLDFTSARRTRFFIALCFAYAVVFFGQVGAIAQLFNMVRERTDVATASTALSVLALTSVVARLAGGALVIRLPTKPFTAALAVLQAIGLVFLAIATSSSALVISAAVFGISIGNLLMLQPLLLAEAFGVVNYGRIYSFNQLFGTIGVAGGPLGLGILRDLYDYEIAFYVAAGASLAGCLFMVLAGSTDRVQRLWQ
ncbi:MAG: MFS transporter [Actinomycetota bacterium]